MMTGGDGGGDDYNDGDDVDDKDDYDVVISTLLRKYQMDYYITCLPFYFPFMQHIFLC